MYQHFPREPNADSSANELERARNATDPAAAIVHLAAALARDPQAPEAVALLEQALPRVGAGTLRELVRARSDVFGLPAIEAYASALGGRFTEGFVRLCEVVRSHPDVPYLAWLDRWLAHNQQPLGRDDAELIGAHAAGLIRNLPDLDAAPPGVAQNLHALADLLGNLEQRNLGAQRLPFALSIVLRRLRRWPEAKAASRKWFESSPSWFSAVEAGNAHREALDLEAATSFYERAIELDPSEPSARLDLADVLLDRGEFEAAAATYETLARRPEQRSWAEPSAYFARWLATGDVRWREELAATVQGPLASQRAHELARYLSYAESALPPVFDRSLRVAFDWVARLAATPPSQRPAEPFRINVRTTVPEAPSVAVAFDGAVQQLGIRCELWSSFEQVPEPDPRLPRGAVRHLLWTWEESGGRAALAPPAPEVARSIAGLAGTSYELRAWHVRAQQLAQELGAGAARELLACMVQPPRAPSADTIAWLRRSQVAAALVLACTDSNTHGDSGDAALRSALQGPADWTVGAAAIALAAVARSSGDEAERRAVELLQDALDGAPRGAFCAYEYDVVVALLFILGPELESRRELWRRLRRLERMYGT